MSNNSPKFYLVSNNSDVLPYLMTNNLLKFYLVSNNSVMLPYLMSNNSLRFYRCLKIHRGLTWCLTIQ